ncbi:MAG: hypothetical protein RL308_1217 [Bacteroidota bacterium]|jgi:hypothetical protein
MQKYKKIIAPIEGKILEVFPERFGMKAGISIVENPKFSLLLFIVPRETFAFFLLLYFALFARRILICPYNHNSVGRHERERA